MGGGDKSLLELSGETLLARIVARLDPQVSHVAINANGDPARFAGFALPVIADPVPGFAGPLAGILIAMQWADANGFGAVATVSGDSPFFPSDLVVRLDGARSGDRAAIAAASSMGRRHPVFALWPTELRADLERDLQSGMRRVNAFIDRHRGIDVAFSVEEIPPIDPFFNINTPRDLREAERLLAP